MPIKYHTLFKWPRKVKMFPPKLKTNGVKISIHIHSNELFRRKPIFKNMLFLKTFQLCQKSSVFWIGNDICFSSNLLIFWDLNNQYQWWNWFKAGVHKSNFMAGKKIRGPVQFFFPLTRIFRKQTECTKVWASTSHIWPKGFMLFMPGVRGLLIMTSRSFHKIGLYQVKP